MYVKQADDADSAGISMLINMKPNARLAVYCTLQQAQQANDSGMTAQEMYIRALMQAFYVSEEQTHSYTAAHTAVDALRSDILDAEYTAEDANEEVIHCHICTN
jgi:hypothetical protein